MELSSCGLKRLFISREELRNPENQTRSYSLELLTYCCIHCSLAILCLAIGLLIKHPIIVI